MKKELTGVAARVYPLIEGTVHECGCEIWDLEFVKEGADRILRITIDTDREGYYHVINENVPVFDGVTAIQQVLLVPVAGGRPDLSPYDLTRFSSGQLPNL